MAQRGYLDSSKMATIFNLLRSNDLIWPYIVNVYQKGQGAAALRPAVLELGFDAHAGGQPQLLSAPLLPRERSLRGADGVRRHRLDLSKVTIPIYHLAAREDHIAPPRSVFAGARPLRRSSHSSSFAGSGHIAGVSTLRRRAAISTGPAARRTARSRTGSRPRRSIRAPGGHDWQAWIEAQGPQAGGRAGDRRRRGLTPIEDAPGSYVRAE